MGACCSDDDSSAKKLKLFWQCFDVRIDVESDETKPINGEYVIVSFDDVVDVVGVKEPGTLVGTNLRAVWCCSRDPKKNVSIGWGTVRRIAADTFGRRVRLAIDARCVSKTLFNFRFDGASSPLPSYTAGQINAIYQAYEAVPRYIRWEMQKCDILRVVADGDDNEQILPYLLPYERLERRVDAVFNVFKKSAVFMAGLESPGFLLLTNLRWIWASKDNPIGKNISVPWLRVEEVLLRKDFNHNGDAIALGMDCHLTIGLRLCDSSHDADRVRHRAHDLRVLSGQKTSRNDENRTLTGDLFEVIKAHWVAATSSTESRLLTQDIRACIGCTAILYLAATTQWKAGRRSCHDSEDGFHALVERPLDPMMDRVQAMLMPIRREAAVTYGT